VREVGEVGESADRGWQPSEEGQCNWGEKVHYGACRISWTEVADAAGREVAKAVILTMLLEGNSPRFWPAERLQLVSRPSSLVLQ